MSDDGEMRVGDFFKPEHYTGIFDVRPEPKDPLPGEGPAAYLRRHGWVQAYFPVHPKEEKVWSHERHTPDGPVVFHHALVLARFPRSQRS